MTFKQICKVINNQVTITLPQNFESTTQVTVVIDDQVDKTSLKLDKLKKAANDPLFIADIMEIQKDFDSIDNETI
jgi:hypothetical protein